MNRGTVLDLVVVMALIFILAISVFVGFLVTNSIRSGFADAGYDTTVADKGIEAYRAWDNVFLVAFGGLSISIIAGAVFIRTHPIFFFASFISLVIVTFFAMIISNVFGEVAGASELINTSIQYPNITLVMSNLPLLIVVIGFAIIIALYSKSGVSQA